MKQELTDNAALQQALDDYVEVIKRRAEGQGTFRAEMDARLAIKALLDAQAAALVALKTQNEALCITLRGIATSSPDESGCYYTNRANISTAKIALAQAMQA